MSAPLTPEAIREKSSEFASYRRNKETNYNEWRLLWDGFHDGYLSAQQQTAAKDEEIAALTKERDEIHESLCFIIDNAPDPNNATERIYREGIEKAERIKELEEHARTMYDKLTGKIAHDQLRIAELENQIYAITEGSEQWEFECSDLKRDKAELLEKVEQLEKERDDLKYKLQKSQDAFTMAETSRSFNKAEADRWKNAFNERNREWLADKKECDLAFALLKEVRKILYFRRFEDLFQRVKTLLSSRENKKPSNIPLEYPGKSYQALFDYLSQHGFIPLNQDMNEIIDLVHDIDSAFKE